jgi:hypothetical protein
LAFLQQPVSLVAERAVRYLKERSDRVDSRTMAEEVLATRVPDEATARRLLESAFAGDPRLVYADLGWHVVGQRPFATSGLEAEPEPDRALVFLRGTRPAGERFRLERISVMRLRQEEVVGACGGDIVQTGSNRHLRESILEALDGALVVVHDPPGSLTVLERWLGAPLLAPISLRRMAQRRLGLAASHDLEALAARLGLMWRSSEDPLEQADILDACLKTLLRPGESLADLCRAASSAAAAIDWSRYAFDRQFLRDLPRAAGMYRFFDRDGRLLYVGKAKDLHRRVNSYFLEGSIRPTRVDRLLSRLHRIDYETSGSELEAILREAEAISRESPEENVQRRYHSRDGRRDRLDTILILESAEPPAVLRAFLISRGKLVARVAIGPRGGGLARVERLLDEWCFVTSGGPIPAAGPDLDVEIVVRWLAANRDRAVAFDPTDLKSAREVTARLRWFLDHGSPFDPDGSPILAR